MVEKEGPWGQTEEPLDDTKEKNDAIDQASRHIILKMLADADVRDPKVNLTMQSGGNPTGNIAHIGFSVEGGDLTDFVPVLAVAVADANRDFFTRNIRLLASYEFIGKSRTIPESSLIVKFLSR